MYRSFYGLSEKPFALTPDPRFLYASPGHQEALAHLVYGVQENSGFLVLTGEVGTGKTTLLQALLQRLNGQAVVAFVVNSGLPFDGFLEYILEQFGIPAAEASRAQRLLALQRFLVERNGAGQRPVLIIDEAHNLTPETLEQIRLLSNFETPAQKLLQIVLVGQPELDDRLELPQLRQLKQRIALRAVVPPLSAQETRQYIHRRLQVAGGRDPGLFTAAAVTAIARYAQGIPRLVNMVCDHCLVVGYGDQKRRIDVDIVKQAIHYLERGASSRPTWQRPRWFAWAALTPVAVGLIALPLFNREAFASVSTLLGDFVQVLVNAARELIGS